MRRFLFAFDGHVNLFVLSLPASGEMEQGTPCLSGESSSMTVLVESSGSSIAGLTGQNP